MFKFLREMLYYQPLIGSKSFRDRILSNELLSVTLLRFLLVISILANVFGTLFPVLGSNDSNFYSVVAKHILLSGDWINLTYAGHDWLDKPHLPFWLTAISYHIFGINAFAYIFPGFVFNLIGARYTFLLTRHIYTAQVGMVASILYLSALHLMLSAVDVRAEAYLLGEIMPACYYWYLYNESNKFKLSYLLRGAFFTALAMMTKGIFVIVTIFSGIILLWVYTRQWKNFISKKWIFALILSFLFISPEIYALIHQFDLHPEKVVFGKTAVSGVKFFFWDSQFGRFFDNGAITSGHAPRGIGHYFYFVHTFLWSFLPWSMFFIVALWNIYKDLRLSPDLPKVSEQKSLHIYFLGCFIPTFVLFSVTQFQLDHYTNILIPFASIMSANWICNKGTRFVTHPVFYFQTIMSYILWLLVSVMSLLAFNGTLFISMISLCVICLALFGIFNNNRYLNKSLVFPVFSIALVFSFAMLVNGRLYLRYDAGYKIGEYLNAEQPLVLVDYKINYSGLEFHNKDPYVRIDNTDDLDKLKKPYYIVVNENDWPDLKSHISNAKILNTFPWIRQEKFIPTIFNLEKRKNDTEQLLVILVPDKVEKESKKSKNHKIKMKE